MTQKQIKKIYKDQGLRLGSGTMELIQEEIYLLVKRQAKRAKSGLGTYKTLTPSLFHIALGINNWGENEH